MCSANGDNTVCSAKDNTVCSSNGDNTIVLRMVITHCVL